MYIHIGASITTVNDKEREAIRKRRKAITDVLDRLGHTYATNLVGVEHPEIPEEYMQQANKSRLESIRALRPDGNAGYSLQEEIGAYLWGIDELKRSGACIFDLTRSSTGTGMESILALQLGKPCLVVYDRPNISTMLNGMLNRLLVVRKWSDQIERDIEVFLKRAQKSLDRTMKFKLSSEQYEWLKNAGAQRGRASAADYLRYLIEEDRRRLDEQS